MSDLLRSRPASFLVAALVATGCGEPDAGPPLAPATATHECDRDFSEIVELLRQELPLYDYDAAVDAAALTERVEVVATGTIRDLVRSGEAGDQWTTITASDMRVLGPPGASAPDGRLTTDARWSQSDVPDPLASAVTLTGVEFIAFLHRAGERYTVDPQGFAIGCAGSDDAATPILDPLPSDIAGRSVADATEAVRSLFVPVTTPNT